MRKIEICKEDETPVIVDLPEIPGDIVTGTAGAAVEDIL